MGIHLNFVNVICLQYKFQEKIGIGVGKMVFAVIVDIRKRHEFGKET